MTLQFFMRKSPKPFIQHIIDAAATTRKLLEGYNYDRFSHDERTQLAIVKLIEIIGEACTHLAKDFESSYPHIPWQAINGMRNRLIHEYWDIDYPTVWKTATKRVPELQKELLPALETIQTQEKETSNQ